MRIVLKTAAVTMASLVVATGTAVAAPPELPTPAKPKFARTVQPSLFGMHAHDLGAPVPQTNQKFGAVRLWDNGIRWDEVNPQRDVYNFETFDRVLTNAEATGAQEILYVLGSTPRWLATDESIPTYLGAPGGNSMPREIGEWDKWVRAVVQRYKGRIDSYQVWNEVNFSSFWSGSAQQMIELTRRAAKIVHAEDPSAKVVTGSAIVRQAKKVSKQSAAISTKSFFYNYMAGLKKKKVKFDAVGMHLYPWFKAGPGDGTPFHREGGAAAARKVLDHFKFKQPMYDTEMAYGNRRPNGWPTRVLSANLGAAYLAQTYIYGMVNNVPQVYWYGWDDHVLGVDVTDAATGAVLAPGVAYNTVMGWMSYAKNGGCTAAKGVNTCLIKQGGQRQYLVFRNTNATKTYTVSKKWKVKQVCAVSSSCQPLKSNRRLAVGISPLLVKP